MLESTFIQRNREKWSQFEHVCYATDHYPPSQLADVYDELMADLAFAQTHYPDSKVTTYLNDMTLKIHLAVYKKGNTSMEQSFVRLVRESIPMALYTHRRMLLYALVLFAFGTFVGVVSQLGDPDFSRLILGDEYVDMSLQNISKGTPTDVYSSSNEATMMAQIPTNNIMVSLRCFVMGILTLFGTGVMAFYNSVMLGCFCTFFYQHGVFSEAMQAVWLHGTIEISAIIVAIAAGFVLGTGWIFPGTMSRRQAFRKNAKQGLYIFLATVPMLLVAGFIESFLTRHAPEWPTALNVAFITLSLVLVVLYIIVWPAKVAKARKRNHEEN